MELRQLKYFAKTAETLNFSEAAKHLSVTQSTLSQQIRQLEEELGTQLFLRNSHGMCLTEPGQSLLPHVLKTLHDAETCVNCINDLQQGLTGQLNIGVTYTFSPILTETLFSFMKSYPHVKLAIYYQSVDELLTRLRAHEIDFALAFRPSTQNSDIESHVLFNNQLAAIVSTNHPLAKQSSVQLSELQKYDLALPIKGLQARNALDKFLAKYAMQMHPRIELNEVNILIKLVKESSLVTILSEATIYNEVGVQAVPIDIPENEMQGCVHMLKDGYRKRSAQEFLRLLSNSNAVRARMSDWI